MVNTIKFRVIYAETDQMGVVYYTRYLEWFEHARNELFRQIGIPYKELEKKEIFLPVYESYCRYRSPARYDEEIKVNTWIASFNSVRIQIRCDVLRDKTLLASGHTWHSFVNKEGKPFRSPKWLSDKIKQYIHTS